MDSLVLKRIKLIVKEEEVPFFSDEDIKSFFIINNSNENKTIYELLLRKSEISTLTISGLTTQDTSNYFKRLASMYYPTNTGNL